MPLGTCYDVVFVTLRLVSNGVLFVRGKMATTMEQVVYSRSSL